MSITTVGSFVSGNGYVSGDSIPYPTGTTAKDVVLAAIIGYTSGIPTLSGFTQIKTQSVSNMYLTMFYRVMQGSDVAPVISSTGSPFYTSMITLRGVDNTNPISSSTTNIAQANSVASGTLTNTKVSNRRFYFGLATGTSTTPSPTITNSLTIESAFSLSSYNQYGAIYSAPADGAPGTIASETMSSSTALNFAALGGVDLTTGNILPTAPTAVSVTNSPVPNGTNPNVSFTFNDPDGTVMSQYQFRWRLID